MSEKAIGNWQLAIGKNHSSQNARYAQIKPVVYCLLPIAVLTVTVPGTSVTNHGLACGVLIDVGKRESAGGEERLAMRAYRAGPVHCSFGESSCIQ